MQREKKKSFKCEICNSHFTQKGKLKLHSSSVHEGKKQVRCEMCGKSFQQKTSLTRHIATVHEGKKPFKCDICDYSCSQQENMKRHVLSVYEEQKLCKCDMARFLLCWVGPHQLQRELCWFLMTAYSSNPAVLCFLLLFASSTHI